MLASILFLILTHETTKHFTFQLCVSNASDKEFRLSIALGNKLKMASLTSFKSKLHSFYTRLKGYAEGDKPIVPICSLESAFLSILQ